MSIFFDTKEESKPHISNTIKVGTQVTIKDGSYMIAIDTTKNELSRFPVGIKGFNGNLVNLGHTYTVVAVNVSCPTDYVQLQSLAKQNNCIIKDNKNDMIWFCSELNLKTVKNFLN